MFQLVDRETGEVSLADIPCGRNACAYCRPRNVQVTAAMMGINASVTDRPPRVAVLSTTRDWLPEEVIRAGWKEQARLVRREVDPDAGYAWFREWTTGTAQGAGGVRRTHFHSTWDVPLEHGPALAEISRRVWAERAGAYSERAHGYAEIWDAGGLARYVAGLAGHHLKSGQAPPPGWAGRRFGTSKGFYAIPVDELRGQAETAVRDARLEHRLTQAILDGASDTIPEYLVDEALTRALEAARERVPLVRVISRPRGPW